MEIKISGNECIGYRVDLIENGVTYHVRKPYNPYDGKKRRIYACGKLENIEITRRKAEALRDQGFSAEYIAMNVVGR